MFEWSGQTNVQTDMFTGLIESIGIVRTVAPMMKGLRLSIDTALAGELLVGESVSTNGVCLTVTEVTSERFDVEVSPETTRVTTLGKLAVGHVVNLERPVLADTRMGGHFVQGHVDAVGCVETIHSESEYHRVKVAFPDSLSRYLVQRGSIALDGVSLTVAELRASTFDVQIIPFTWEHTAFSKYSESDAVNLECDILGKYVMRAMEIKSPDSC